jgi:hypothetical protein
MRAALLLGNISMMATAAVANGTRGSLEAFMRPAGTCRKWMDGVVGVSPDERNCAAFQS